MSKLTALQGKSKVFKIGEIELELKPLGLEDMSKFSINENSSIEKQSEASVGLVKKTLKDSVPDATDEEISNISFKYMEELMKAIMDVNGLKKDDSTIGNIKDVIKARQSQIKSKGTKTE